MTKKLCCKSEGKFLKRAEKIIADSGTESRMLLQVLLKVNKEFGWLPKELLELVSKKLDVPLSRVYAAATFYKTFSLEPKGEHVFHVCLGTACHVRGGQNVVDDLTSHLGIKPGETTNDGKFTVETVACVGACALAPVMVVDGEYHGGLTGKDAVELAKKTAKKKGGR